MPHDDGAAQDDRERRLAALREIAAQASQNNAPTERMPGVAAPRQPLSRRGRRFPAWALVALAVVVVAGVAGGAWVILRGRAPAASAVVTMPATRTVDLAKEGVYCPTQPLWSPDGTRIAMFTNLSNCAGSGGMRPAITVIDARSGKLVMNIPLNRALQAQGLAQQFFTPQFAWSPDGKSLAFAINYSGFFIPNVVIPHGLVVVTVPGGKLAYYPDTKPMPKLTEASTLIFDTRSGALAHVIGDLPYAKAYSWSADGLLAPDPAGSVSFWQPGFIQPVMTNLASGTPIPATSPLLRPRSFYYLANSALWSPDGHYLALPATLGVRLTGGNNPKSTLAAGDTCPNQLLSACATTTKVAAPSAGFAAALAAAEAGQSFPDQAFTNWNSMDVAPRADGREIAVMLPGQDFNAQQMQSAQVETVKVTVFDAATGAKVHVLSVTRADLSISGGGVTPALAWSPRGSSLALADFGDSTITIWRAV
ncbi:MAG TPA: hypothetical protein VF725_16175 [Ktedonobacterales bacterium]